MGAESVAGTPPVLKIYDGAYHQLLNEPNRDEVIRDLAALSKVFFFSTSDPLMQKKGPSWRGKTHQLIPQSIHWEGLSSGASIDR